MLEFSLCSQTKEKLKQEYLRHNSCLPKMRDLCDILFLLSLSFVSPWTKLTESFNPSNSSSQILNYRISSCLPSLRSIVAANDTNIKTITCCIPLLVTVFFLISDPLMVRFDVLIFHLAFWFCINVFSHIKAMINTWRIKILKDIW